MEQAVINNHRAGGEMVAKSDSPRTRWWGRPAIRMNLIAAAVLAFVGLAVVPFVRVDVQPRREVGHVFQLKSGKRAIEDLTNRDFDRYGDAGPAPAAAPLAPGAAGPAPKRLRAAAVRGEGVSRSFGLSQGAPNKPASEPAKFAFQEVDGAAGAGEGQFGGMGGGANGNKQVATAGRKLAEAGVSAPATTPTPRFVTATGAQRSGEAASSQLRPGDPNRRLPCARRAAEWNRATHGRSRS